MTSHDTTADSADRPAYVIALRGRIGWICQLVRYASVAYAAWVLALIAMFWMDGDKVRRLHSFLTKAQLTEAPPLNRALGFALGFIDWLFVAAAVYAVWRLMGEYLKGRIFEPAAATWLRRIGTFGLGAMAVDIALRPLMTAVSSLHMPEGMRFIAIHFQPNDLLNVLFLSAFIALAHIFKSAAELADDHAQIV